VTIFLRLPAIIADLILGILIYYFVRKRASEKSAILGSALFLFTPPVWYNSAFWGQMDALNNLMFFMAIFFLYQSRYFWSTLFAFLTLFIKFSLLPILPLFFYFLFIKINSNLKQFISIILICTFIIYILTIPVSHTNIFWIIDFIKNNTLGEMQSITNFAFNFWWVIIHPSITLGNPNSLFSFSEVRLINSPLDSTLFLFLPLKFWSIGLFIIFSLFSIKKLHLFKEKLITPQNLLLIFCLLSMLSFFFLPRMHERYLYPLFPLMAALIGLSGKYIKTFIFLSLLNFLNLYIVWHPMTLWFLPYELINNSTFQWLISLTILISISIFYYKAIFVNFFYERKK
jgi:Gpi18-like mannosyltransferase